MSTKFIDHETPICAEWLNTVDTVITPIAASLSTQDPSVEDVRDALDAAAKNHTHNYPLYQPYQPAVAVTTIARFEPDYWRVNGPRTINFAVTPLGNGFKAYFVARQKDDFAGVIWDSEDTHDHKSLAYVTNRDYSTLVWDFDIELSASMAVFDDPSYAYSLTISGRDSTGNPVLYYVALKNFMSGAEAATRIGHVTINFATAKAGFNADIDMELIDIDTIMLGLFPSGYIDNDTTPFVAPIEGYIKVSNSIVTGTSATLQKNTLNLPPHHIAMCTSYDDMMHLNPRRIINNIVTLGYRGWINHYCGMSAFPSRYWDAGEGRYLVPKPTDGKPFINAAAEAWHLEFATRAKDAGYKLIQSVSFELYSEFARLDWVQRDWNGDLGATGYTPPSYLLSPCNTEAMSYLQECLIAVGSIAQTPLLDVHLQVGEPWWWVNPTSRMPCVYDVATRDLFHTDTGLYMADFGTVLEGETKTGSPYDEMKAFLQLTLGQAVQGCRDAIKHAIPSAQVTTLVFLPTIADPSMGIMQEINLPNIAYQYPQFDFIMTEAYDWVIYDDMVSAYKAMTYPLHTLGYPKEKVQYLGGCTLTDMPQSFRDQVWPRVFGNLINNASYHIEQQYLWAYPQVMQDSVTIVAQNDLLFFEMNGQMVQSVRA